MKKFIYSLMLLPLTSFAADGVSPPKDKPMFNNLDEVLAKIYDLMDWVFTGAFILTILFVLIAAYKMITSGGGKGVEEGKQTLIWAIIGFAVALIAKAVPVVVESFLGV